MTFELDNGGLDDDVVVEVYELTELVDTEEHVMEIRVEHYWNEEEFTQCFDDLEELDEAYTRVEASDVEKSTCVTD